MCHFVHCIKLFSVLLFSVCFSRSNLSQKYKEVYEFGSFRENYYIIFLRNLNEIFIEVILNEFMAN